MTPLIAYDFDKTLVPYDSFRRYMFHLLRLMPIRIGSLLLLRRLRLISGRCLKAKVTEIVNHSERLQVDAQYFAKCLVYDVQLPRPTSNATKSVLVTASPKIYMQHVAAELCFDLLCSDYRGSNYVEMYGEEKKTRILASYPQTEYEYVFAASDSCIDLCWMHEFKEYKLIKA